MDEYLRTHPDDLVDGCLPVDHEQNLVDICKQADTEMEPKLIDGGDSEIIFQKSKIGVFWPCVNPDTIKKQKKILDIPH